MLVRSIRTLLPLAAAVALTSCSEVTAGLDCSGGVDMDVGDVRAGTLQAGDALDVDGAYLDAFALRVTSQQNVRIRMTSTAVDAFLWLLDDEGNIVGGDDDSAGGTNAEIVSSLARGCYVIEATSFGVGETGSYSLSADGV